ncbi:MAG: DNA-deoxyinosine glycosylase, partial [Gammaproteobacteria bacterium]|nr:DNA-deoxyinosine glycosylase [Gammaproteobacteria bacterium]
VNDSIVVNDFTGVRSEHRDVGAIFFNGARSAATFRRYAAPALAGLLDGIELHTLPSTSPANATFSLAAKIENWRIIERYLRR